MDDNTLKDGGDLHNPWEEQERSSTLKKVDRERQQYGLIKIKAGSNDNSIMRTDYLNLHRNTKAQTPCNFQKGAKGHF